VNVVLNVTTKALLLEKEGHILKLYILLELCIKMVLPAQKYYFYSNKKTN
jgi:hypothetical protein